MSPWSYVISNTNLIFLEIRFSKSPHKGKFSVFGFVMYALHLSFVPIVRALYIFLVAHDVYNAS